MGLLKGGVGNNHQHRLVHHVTKKIRQMGKTAMGVGPPEVLHLYSNLPLA